MSKLLDLNRIGQSIWYDNIRRALIETGELQKLIDAGVVGVTSNPSIFEKAIAGSTDYDDAIRALVKEGHHVEAIYENLALEDIGHTADLLHPVYEETNGLDGYVSLEVSPTLAHDTQGTIDDARRLFKALGRPNVMIKVPATPAGIPAIRALISEGININVTLIFSLASYEQVMESYLAGLEAYGGNLAQIASVASFFVSRVDSAVDKALAAAGNTELQGKIAIANAKAAYGRFQEIFSGPRWEKLIQRGARVQRPLWASTSTKNPAYPDTMYLDELIGPDTVNTVPPATLVAFQEHGVVAETLTIGLDEALAQLAQLAQLGVDLDVITQQLLDDGVSAFANSFTSLLASVSEKRDRLLSTPTYQLAGKLAIVDSGLAALEQNQIMQRIWSHDHTVWKENPSEISNRLGWLEIAEKMREQTGRLRTFANNILADGYTDALLLGMGGSSLAPEVFAKTFGDGSDGLNLHILDSTDADAVRAATNRLDLAKTLFIVSTKSGGTVETLSFFKYFFNQIGDGAGSQFVAITDPGSRLETIAQEYHFREIFLNDPNLGGRYSALSYFGLVPASLVGLDLDRLLESAIKMAENAKTHGPQNQSARLGAVLGELGKAGVDKLTIFTSPEIASFGDWVEQLMAESTGKEGKGILPVVHEPAGPVDVYGRDRIFVYLHLLNDVTHDPDFEAWAAANHPVVKIPLGDKYDLGGQFFLWEMATAVAGYFLNIQPFDQPNVEAAKILARQMVAEFMEKGSLPAGDSALVTAESLRQFVKKTKPGDYVAIQAYIQPTAEADALLQTLRTRLRNKYQVATTVGYGPRFLHSTGQLHKGDRGNGFFIQLASDPVADVAIPDKAGQPDSTMTFGVLKLAQALGDAQALEEADRRVIRFHLGTDVNQGLKALLAG